MSTTTDPEIKPIVQVFCRAYLVDEFRSNFEPLSERFDFRFFCDGNKPGTQDTREAFYRHWHNCDISLLLTEDEIDDCVQRCRLLRNIDRPDALRLLHAMALSLDSQLEASRPSLVICHMVDEYVTYLLATLARKRGIAYLGYIYSYFPGYVQVIESSMGLGFDVREPTQEEAEAIVTRYSSGRFRRDYAQKQRGTVLRQLKSVLRYRLKLVYFWLKGRVERDPLNVHYLITPYVAEYRHMRNLPPADIFDRDWANRIENERSAGRRVVFLPLGYFPESAIDYWVGNTSIIDYERKTIEMVASMGRRFAVAVKEHPHMIGARARAFYDRLAKVPGVIMVPPEVYATEVMDDADAVVLGGGSGGVEARLRNRPVFSYCDTSYWFEVSGATFLDLDSTDGWPDVIEARLAVAETPTDSSRLEFAKACLRSTVHERPGAGRWPLCAPEELEVVLRRGIAQGARASITRHDRADKATIGS